jgi:hypothetical protein
MCVYNIVSDAEIEQVAADESQQDWNDLRYAAIYREAFIDGAKWALTRANTNFESVLIGTGESC